MTATTPAPIPFLDLVTPHRQLKGEIMDAIGAAMDTAGFIGGAQLTAFEAAFAAFCGTPDAVGVANGTDALRLALLALGVGAGDRVVTVPNTFIATTEAISQAGAAIDFVDIDPATCLMDPQQLEDLLVRRFASGAAELRPKAIIPVHLYGQCADMDAINALARRFDLIVLEDAAQAHGATQKGRPAGSMGNAAAFSFYPGKNLGACGEAGAVTTADADVAARLRILREHGQREKYVHVVEGYNARLDAIQAAILRIKLRELPKWNALRRAAADRYDLAFAGIGNIRPVAVAKDNVACRHLYVIHVPDRDAVGAALKANGIGFGYHYPIPLHLQECYAGLGGCVGDFPHAEASCGTLISLPMFPGLTDSMVDRVVSVVRAAVAM